MQRSSAVWTVMTVVIIAMGALNFFTYQALSAQVSGDASEVSSVRSVNSQLQSQVSEVKSQLSNSTAAIDSLRQTNSQIQSQVTGLTAELNLTLVRIGNLTAAVDLTQGNISSIESTLSSLHSFQVFQANYVGNGQAGHNISVPFAPVLVFIVDYTAGMQATVYFGVNDTSAFYFRGLQLYEADYSYGGGVGAFYHDGLFDMSWVGSAPVGTMNVEGDNYYAIFYGW